jgi:hypothetical protein
MRAIVTAVTLCAALAAITSDVRPSRAQSARTYPYCALDSSSGATSCYYDTRAACGSRCIGNPAYVGSEGVMANGRGSYRVPRR